MQPPQGSRAPQVGSVRVGGRGARTPGWSLGCALLALSAAAGGCGTDSDHEAAASTATGGATGGSGDDARDAGDGKLDASAGGGKLDASAGGGRLDAGTGGGSGGSDAASGGSRVGTGGETPEPEAGSGGSDRSTGGSAAGGEAGSPEAGRDAGSGAGAAGSGGAALSVELPPANAPFDYQLGGAYAPPEGVEVVSRDRHDPPAADLYNICYVNGFQTQPDEEDFWLGEHPDLVLRDVAGDPVVDEDWGEMLLDVSTAEKREALGSIVGAWIAQCAEDGFDAVELDNLDSYSRSDGLLEQSQAVAFIGMLSRIAHEHGLASAQKNSVELLDDAEAMGTDFAVAEECNRWNECADYQRVYGDRVFVIEYRDPDFEAGCANFSELSIVRRDLDLTTPRSSSYVYDAC